jgi:hypothetical protein
MKALGLSLVKALIGSRLGLAAGRRIRTYMRNRRARGGRRATRRRGRRGRRGINNLIANANAVGGFKSISNTGPLRPLIVDIYQRMIVMPRTRLDSSYLTGAYEFYYDNDTSGIELDMVSLLNQDQEFLDWRQYSSAFVVDSCTVNFNYCRMPRDGEYFPKMLIYPETDVVDFVPDPTQERNTMVWDMTNPGNKNYNVRFVRRNMYTQDLGWQVSSNGWTGTYKIRVAQYEGDNSVKIKIVDQQESTDPVHIGTIHATFKILFRTLDQAHSWSKVGGVDQPVPTKIKRQLLEKMFLEYHKDEKYNDRLQYLNNNINQQLQLKSQAQQQNKKAEEMQIQLANYDMLF